MLIDKDPVGIVSVWEDRIENLYVLPEKQRCGYGSALLAHAIEQCEGNPSLSVLNINEGAQKLYERAGFVETGSIKRLSDSLWEIEMALEQR